ncbi:Cupredoxin [Pseudoneurospora amorphoporcata]|uniref:laccase n=1 Tax=Pseudoneurospora amorphoporcata TaxID=241081 RepID=A0AAN6P1I8_9PEZI|nr:Cupredoxin [Pseudoneurospora amorphoporcata]
MYVQPKRPDFVRQQVWDQEMGRATSGLPSLVIKMDILLFNPSPVRLPQDWPTDIEIDQYVRHTPKASYKARLVTLRITNMTNWVGPDGVVKPAMLINNTFLGPTIAADWGDYVQVNVYNDLQHNGYHSHYSNQYGNRVVGALIVNGPASANYDIDLGPYMIQDYYRQTADRFHYVAELVQNGPPPDSNTITFRGKSINPTGSGGSYDRLILTPGKKHLLRLINASVDNSFTISLVGHNFTVIATDFVPVTPVIRSKLFMAVGQRYDVIVEANHAVGRLL